MKNKNNLIKKIRRAIFLPPPLRKRWIAVLEKDTISGYGLQVFDQLFEYLRADFISAIQQKLSSEFLEKFQIYGSKIQKTLLHSQERKDEISDQKHLKHLLKKLHGG